MIIKDLVRHLNERLKNIDEYNKGKDPQAVQKDFNLTRTVQLRKYKAIVECNSHYSIFLPKQLLKNTARSAKASKSNMPSLLNKSL